VVPEFFLTETITVTEPSGKETLIWNPLYTYRFRNVPADEFDDKVSARCDHHSDSKLMIV
jgi:hypothetical protein